MDRLRIPFLAPWLPLAVALGCAADPGPPRPDLVVASVPPLAWLAAALAPPGVEVVSLVPEGASPSAHAPGVRELRALSRAALWVRVGHPHFPFEAAWLDPLAAERPDLRVVSLLPEGEPGFEDPHVWMDPARMADAADRVAAALAALHPEAADAIETRRRALRAELADLEDELTSLLTPHAGQPFVVFHPAFSHLAERHGLVQLAVEAGHREVSGPELARVVRRARAAGVDTVFVQPQFDRAGALVVAAELDARVATLDPLAADWPSGLRATARALAASFTP